MTLVGPTLSMDCQQSAARTPPGKTSLERQIAAAGRQIGRLVYGLYGLTEEEIKIVEGAL